MKPILYLLTGMILSACSADVDIHTLEALNQPLSPDASVTVQIPHDGRYEDIVYEDSGQKVAAAFKTEFDRYAPSTKLVGDCEGKACIEDASRAGADYFAALEIVHWEERQTAWSGTLDRVTIKVTVFDVAKGTELTSTYLQGAGSGHVDDMLPDIVPPYVSSLY